MARARAMPMKNRVAVALVALVTVLSLVLSLTQAGRQYFYCKAMGVLATDPCRADASSHKTTLDDIEQTHTDCCKVIKMPLVQQGALTRADAIADARWTGVVAPPVLTNLHRAEVSTSRPSTRVRSRPPPSIRLHTRIMVFLT